jgi:hypothetical protein
MLRSILKNLWIIVTFPFSILLLSFLSKSKIYELFFISHFSRKLNKKKNLFKNIVFRNYYIFPNYLKKKIILSSMGNDQEALDWAEYYRKIPFPGNNNFSGTAYNYLIDYIKKNKKKNIHIHQVAASSAREINYFSKFSDSITFEASDFTESIVNNMKNHYPHLKCYTVDLSDNAQLTKITKRCELIISFGGLQYLLPDELEIFFNICFENNCEIILSQPISADINPYNLKKSKPRGNMSWSHPYVILPKKAGYRNLKSNTGLFSADGLTKTFYAHFF